MIKTNIVFQGGGARGAYQYEFFSQLQDLFNIESVCGSSTGALTAFCVAKKIPYDYMQKLYDDVFANDARMIFKPGIGSIKGGKFKLNDWKFFPKLLFARNKIKGFMSAEPLINLIEKIHREFPTFHYNYSGAFVDLHTSRTVYFQYSDFDNDREFCRAVAASCSIPGLVEPIRDIRMINATYKCCVDGGVREGFPVKRAFDVMNPENFYQVLLVGCNTPDVTPQDDLDSIFGILGATGVAVLNELAIDDVYKVELINELVKEKGEAVIGKKYVPVHKVFYSGGRGSLAFTTEALKSFRASAVIDADRLRRTITTSI